jgi:hypothetical protein
VSYHLSGRRRKRKKKGKREEKAVLTVLSGAGGNPRGKRGCSPHSPMRL